MKRVVLALAGVVCLHAQPDVVGDWQGTLQAGGASYRLVVHIVKNEAGLVGTLDSLDQGALGLKLADVRLDGGTLRFALSQAGAQFEGAWHAEAAEFRGNWSQSGGVFPLSFKRAPKPASERPIRERDVFGRASELLTIAAHTTRDLAKIDAVHAEGNFPHAHGVLRF
jgi:hypothetical protein